MKMLKIHFKVSLILILLIFSNSVTAQEKVILSTDRDIYVSGEGIWLTVGVYQLDSNEPSNLSKVVYVELMNPKNVPVVQLKYRLDEQASQSRFFIPDSLSTGNYSLRGYTRWMQNNDRSLYARKKISIINPFVISSLPSKDKYFSGDTIFTFPEGGLLYPGVENKVIVRTLNSTGKAKVTEGKVVNKNNKIVSSFKTDTEGYGLLKFIPENKEKYFYCFGDVRLSLPNVSKEKLYLKLIKDNSVGYSFSIHGEFKNNVWLDIVSKDGVFNKRYDIPADGNILVDNKKLNDNIFFALLVNNKNDILAYRAFSNCAKECELNIKLDTDKECYGRREKVNLNIDKLKALKKISVSVVKSCLLNPNRQLKSYCLNKNDALIALKPSIFAKKNVGRLLLPEAEGELVTGRITCIETGKPIVGEKFMLNFVSRIPIMQFSTTDSLGRFRFNVNRYGEEEMVIQSFTNDTTFLNYKITIDDNFSTNYNLGENQPLVMDSVNAKRINEAIVNMQINTIYSAYRKNSLVVNPVQDSLAFYGTPNASTVVDKYIGLPTVEELVREVVRFTGVRKNANKYYFRVYESNSLYPRECKTLTFMDGVPIRNVKNIFDVLPQDLSKIDVVNLNYYLQDEELGYLLCFYSKDNNMADMEFDQHIFRQVHKGFVANYKYKSPNYSDSEVKKSHLADFRNVLYYNTLSVKENGDQIDLSFYTSDEETEYTIVVKGINEEGEIVESTMNFNVSDPI